MALESAKRSLEEAAVETLPTPALDALPSKFYDAFLLRGLRIDLMEPGSLLCSMTLPARLLVSPFFCALAFSDLDSIVLPCHCRTQETFCTAAPLRHWSILSALQLSTPLGLRQGELLWRLASPIWMLPLLM